MKKNKKINFIITDFFKEQHSPRISESGHLLVFDNLWQHENALIVPANIIDDEVRYALVSILKNKCYTAIFIIRDETYRIISVRRCRKNEEKNYENNNS